LRSHRLSSTAALVCLVGAGCGGSEHVSEYENTTCEEIRADKSWRAVASELAEVLTDANQKPSEDRIDTYERLYRKACAGAPDDFKPQRRVQELRGDELR
jgi:hypothetical protein